MMTPFRLFASLSQEAIDGFEEALNYLDQPMIPIYVLVLPGIVGVMSGAFLSCLVILAAIIGLIGLIL